MPDVFGQETPQEAVARVKGAFGRQNRNFQNSGAANSDGAQVGQALVNIFAPTAKKFLDTRRDRKSTAERIAATQGISLEEASALAKQQVPFGHSEVRVAGMKRKVATEAEELIAQLTPSVGPELAQASGMILQARKLRELGFNSEATKMTLAAGKIRQAEELRVAELENLKSRTRSSSIAADAAEAGIEFIGETDFSKLTNQAEVLRAERRRN